MMIRFMGKAGMTPFSGATGTATMCEEGGAGTDKALVIGSSHADLIAVSANGGRVSVVEETGTPIDPDMAGIERLSIKAVGGADRILVGDLNGTDLKTITIFAGAGNDRVDASAVKAGVNVTLIGGRGNDILLGGSGNDRLTYPQDCRFPQEKRPSVESFSFDVIGTLHNLGLNSQGAVNKTDTFNYYGIILLE